MKSHTCHDLKIERKKKKESTRHVVQSFFSFVSLLCGFQINLLHLHQAEHIPSLAAPPS